MASRPAATTVKSWPLSAYGHRRCLRKACPLPASEPWRRLRMSPAANAHADPPWRGTLLVGARRATGDAEAPLVVGTDPVARVVLGVDTAPHETYGHGLRRPAAAAAARGGAAGRGRGWRWRPGPGAGTRTARTCADRTVRASTGPDRSTSTAAVGSTCCAPSGGVYESTPVLSSDSSDAAISSEVSTTNASPSSSAQGTAAAAAGPAPRGRPRPADRCRRAAPG